MHQEKNNKYVVLTQIWLPRDAVKTVSTLLVILYFFSHTMFENFSETNAYKIHGFNTSTLLSHRHFFNHNATLRSGKKIQ